MNKSRLWRETSQDKVDKLLGMQHFGTELHFYPLQGQVKPHYFTKNCWCQPQVTFAKNMYMHYNDTIALCSLEKV